MTGTGGGAIASGVPVRESLILRRAGGRDCSVRHDLGRGDRRKAYHCTFWAARKAERRRMGECASDPRSEGMGSQVEQVQQFGLRVDVALREGALEMRANGVDGDAELLCRLLDRVSFEEVSGDCGLGGGQTVEVAQQLVRDHVFGVRVEDVHQHGDVCATRSM